MKTRLVYLIGLSALLLPLVSSAQNQDGKRANSNRDASPEAAFARLDANQSGTIDREEVQNRRIAKRFDQVDANSDGVITLDEFTTARAQNRERMQERVAARQAEGCCPEGPKAKGSDAADRGEMTRREIRQQRQLNRAKECQSD